VRGRSSFEAVSFLEIDGAHQRNRSSSSYHTRQPRANADGAPPK
jgi:hypothetical protein